MPEGVNGKRKRMGKVIFQDKAWEEYLFWQNTDRKIVKKINALIKDTVRDPFQGIGKPEPLKEDKGGQWSRHITKEHRFVYEIGDGIIEIVSCMGHYED